MNDKYKNDIQYAHCVDMMKTMIHNNQFTPSEMREMAVLACIHYEMSKPIKYSFKLTPELEASLKTLEDFREK